MKNKIANKKWLTALIVMGLAVLTALPQLWHGGPAGIPLALLRL